MLVSIMITGKPLIIFDLPSWKTFTAFFQSMMCR